MTLLSVNFMDIINGQCMALVKKYVYKDVFLRKFYSMLTVK